MMIPALLLIVLLRDGTDFLTGIWLEQAMVLQELKIVTGRLLMV